MLVECPKCHFKQPHDQYCANCGVDMLAFKPIEEPTHRKFFRSGIFQFVLVIIIGFLASYFVVKTTPSQQWIQKINRFTTINLSSEPPPPTNDSAAENANSSDTELSTNFNQENAMQSASATINALGDADSKKNLAEDGTIESRSITVKMLEVDGEVADGIIRKIYESNTMLIDSDFKVGVIKNMPSISSKSMQLTHDKISFDENGYGQKWYGNNATDEQAKLGLSIKTSLHNINNNTNTDESYDISIEVSKIHPSNRLDIPIKLQLKSDETLVIIGHSILNYLEYENEIAEISPFHIFKSVDFKNMKNNFAIIVNINK